MSASDATSSMGDLAEQASETSTLRADERAAFEEEDEERAEDVEVMI